MTTETHFGRDVLLEEELVFLPAGKNRRVIWVQCPSCGPQPPATAWNPGRGRDALIYHAPDPTISPPLICSVCGQDSPYKEILIPRERKRAHERCTNKCLDGKTFCACGCRGKCHGEGSCTCKEAA